MRRIGLGVARGRGVAAAALAGGAVIAVVLAVVLAAGLLGRPLPHAATPAGVTATPAPVPGLVAARTARDALPGPAPDADARPQPAAVVAGVPGERAGARPGWPGPPGGAPALLILAVLAAAALLAGPAGRGVASAAAAAQPHPFRGGARPGRAPPAPVGC